MKDKLPFERPLKDALRIYIERWGLWLLWVIVCGSPLVALWMVKCE